MFKIIFGEEKMCFVVIEFNLGFDMLLFEIKVEWINFGYMINGCKIWMIGV